MYQQVLVYRGGNTNAIYNYCTCMSNTTSLVKDSHKDRITLLSQTS